MTVFNCSRCNKQLRPEEREYCDKHNSTWCAQCLYFDTIGVRTIADYNRWLRGDWFGTSLGMRL